VGYFRRWYGNFRVTDDLAVAASDFDQFSVTAPTDPRLGENSGKTFSGIFDLKPAAFGRPARSYNTLSDEYGTQKEHWNGVDVTVCLSSVARAGDAYDEYISDPAKPVPYRSRPNLPQGYTDELTWWRWLVDDQREASGRTDVLTYTTDVLRSPVKISGQAIVNLIASTSGTDSDWVVKLIDVYPDEVMGQPELGGYQLGVSMDIFRGRYRESYETPKPIEANKPLLYKWPLPNANHVFLPGHRIMVQIQSSWFPLYDRNPQTFVPNIFFAKPADYKKATQRVYHSSFIELPVVEGAGN
jgi:putative CocE/NonD family hydrolase